MAGFLTHQNNNILFHIIPQNLRHPFQFFLIREIRAHEWTSLVQQILNQSAYETVILDIDAGIRDVYELLEICSEIHLLEDESEYSAAKMEQYERELAILGHEDILSKTMRKGDHTWSKQVSSMSGF